MKRPDRKIDWAAIEKDYRFGTMSNVALAEWYSVSESAIRKRAKRDSWVRASATPHQSAPVPSGTLATPETTRPETIIGRGRNLTLRLLDELDATTSRVGELHALIDSALDEGDKKREALEQAISLKTRAEVLKSLALTAKTFAEAGAPAGKKAERQAAAERAAGAGGKFAPPAAPRLAVNNG